MQITAAFLPNVQSFVGEKMNCRQCNAVLTTDDIGAYRKFWEREPKDFLCIPCLCEKMKCSEEYLRARIQFLKNNGCALFPHKKQ